MKRKDLQHLNLNSTSFNTAPKSSTHTVIEGIDIRQNYSAKDVEAIELDFAAGFAPFVRGISPLMYVQQPWNSELLPATNALEAGNISYRKQLALGQKNLLFDLSSQTTAGSFTIDTVEDLNVLLAQLPLAKITATIRTNEALLPLLAQYFVAAQEQGIDPKLLHGNLQYDALDFTDESAPLLQKAILDSLVYTSQYMPNFKILSLSNSSLKERNSTAAQEIAYSLAQGLALVTAGVQAQLPLDYVASQVVFSWTVGVNHFMEIAKMRAARLLWAKLIRRFEPKNEQTLALSIQAQTQTWGTEPTGDLTRTMVASTAAIFGGTQALSLAFDHPSYGEHTALQLHKFIQEEMKATKTVDPWAGSYYVEHTTLTLAEQAWNILATIDPTDPIAHLVSQTVPQKESSQQQIADTTSPRDPIQAQRLASVKAQRNIKKVEAALARLTQAATQSTSNLFALAIEAARERATTEEIQRALLSK
ncbi:MULTISPECIES: methylmalonyl-CoA mutase family protein [unclassified Myroides]|uniref:methylmalonyl-CoA mutase family protein n=1 Tax=unclassified Myroides TaxID=2642485 RepID=UPI003D2F81F1